MAAALGGQDHLYTLVEKGDGEPSAEVIGSIVGFVHAPAGHDAAVAQLIAVADDGDPLADRHGGRLCRAGSRAVGGRRADDLRSHRRRAGASAARAPPDR